MDDEKEKVKAITFALATLLLIASVFYHVVEGWSWVDSFYFTAITITTLGYGDLVPTHDVSKIFTVFLAFSGIGIVFYYFNIVAKYYLDIIERRMRRRYSFLKKK